MAISNLQETLLMYSKYKSMMNLKMAGIQMNILAATTRIAEEQEKFNRKQQDLYYKYEPDEMWGERSEYLLAMEQMQNDLEFSQQNIKSWEEELEMDKLNCEARITEIQTNEASVRAMLKNNLKSDFTYGGASQS